MQTCIHLPPSPASFLSLPSIKPSSFLSYSPPTTKRQLGQTSIKAAASASDNAQVDYSSMASSVFPAEACETVGGDACDVEMFPETKIKQQSNPKPTPPPTSQPLDTDYLDYNNPKTVFIAEACDDLGGEFCEPTYQSGVN